MAEPRKRQALKAQRTLHPAPETVTAELFLMHPEFFDPEDKLQVRYELMRSTDQGEMTVTEACRAFGVSRQTFYVLQRAFRARGVAGLMDAKRGRKGPIKATVELVRFVRKAKQDSPQLSGAELVVLVEDRFGIKLHRRTVERLLQPKKA